MKHTRTLLLIAALLTLIAWRPSVSWALASNNIPLDSQIYVYLDKLDGFRLINTDIHGLKPYTKAEAARLIIEAEENLGKMGDDAPEVARQMIRTVKDLLPREMELYGHEDKAQGFKANLLAATRLRYVYLEGEPRSFERVIPDLGGEGIFGIGHLRLTFPKGHNIKAGGSEGTPLFENNEGIRYIEHNSVELKTDSELFYSWWTSALVEPVALASGIGERPEGGTHTELRLNKGYLKLGGGSIELEAGRDQNWFGQGFRGTTVLTNNARNLDELKLSSPEPIDWAWLKRNIGLVKYAIIFSRLDESGKNENLRHPWFFAAKLSVKPTQDFELGFNFAGQFRGPNVESRGGFFGLFSFGGGANSNALAGIELRYRLPILRGTTIYWEYYGEDAEVVLPTVESHLAGLYVPRLTADGKNDLRFEFWYSNKLAYTDFKYPEGFTNGDMIMGHSQGGDIKEYFVKFTHYFWARNRVSAEYFNTQRGRIGAIFPQVPEDKNAARVFWNFPVSDNWDALASYGYEHVKNFNLEKGQNRDNHLVRVDLSYRY